MNLLELEDAQQLITQRLIEAEQRRSARLAAAGQRLQGRAAWLSQKAERASRQAERAICEAREHAPGCSHPTTRRRSRTNDRVDFVNRIGSGS